MIWAWEEGCHTVQDSFPFSLRVLVTVVKHVTVREVKGALVELVGVVLPLESIILAEVKEGSIMRVLVSGTLQCQADCVTDHLID